MQKDDLIELMIGLAVDALEEEGVEEFIQVNRDSPLLGSEAILNSMDLVALITGVESMLEEEHQIDVTLVSEDAFSRQRSPFRTIDALADYILELSGAPADDVMERVHMRAGVPETMALSPALLLFFFRGQPRLEFGLQFALSLAFGLPCVERLRSVEDIVAQHTQARVDR